MNDMKKEITFLKNELVSLNSKVDLVLEILNNFTLMLAEETEDEDLYDTQDSWTPDQDEDWNSYEDE